MRNILYLTYPSTHPVARNLQNFLNNSTMKIQNAYYITYPKFATIPVETNQNLIVR